MIDSRGYIRPLRTPTLADVQLVMATKHLRLYREMLGLARKYESKAVFAHFFLLGHVEGNYRAKARLLREKAREIA